MSQSIEGAASVEKLIFLEGWTVEGAGTGKYVVLDGEKVGICDERTGELNHPVTVHLKMYRDSINPETKFKHMKAAHDYLWPHHKGTWNFWTERRFRTHCEPWKCVTYAGGASCAKSFDAAKIAIMFWVANPRKRGVLVMSTTLEALNTRIYGYVTRLIQEMVVGLPWKSFSGNNPRIIFPQRRGFPPDFVHSIAAVAAKKGDDDTAISSLIGRHPTEGLLVVCDEGTDMPMAILGAVPNLAAKIKTFQLMCIGNSNSKYDLHGALSTPRAGWRSVDPLVDFKWETTQPGGVCLFFSCYESPAILEEDSEKRVRLSKIFITLPQIAEAMENYGEKSEKFYRFTLGFWRSDGTEDLVMSQQFLSEYPVSGRTEWGGQYPLRRVAGLDPAFSTGGDGCIFRIGLLGTDSDGLDVLDFREESLLFEIKIDPTVQLSAEKQIAHKVVALCKEHGVGIGDICIDSNGQGRALSSVIDLTARTLETPIKIYSNQSGNLQVNSFDVVIKTPHELWYSFRDFIQHGQIKGLDAVTLRQLSSRKEFLKNGKKILEPKNDYKKRMGAQSPGMAHSPDEADAAALCLQAAILRYGFTPGKRREVIIEQGFEHEKMREFRLMHEMGSSVSSKISLETPTLSATFSGTLEDMVSTKDS